MSVSPWVDENLKPGELWEEEIRKAIAESRAAVLLVSADFLASKFIMEKELPLLFEAERTGKLVILWFAVKSSGVAQTDIGKREALHDPSRPLNRLNRDRREEAFVEICGKIQARVQDRVGMHESRPEAPRFNSSRLPSTGDHWVGRKGELARLSAAWANPLTNVVVVVGPGGLGKTSLVKQWRQFMAKKNFDGAERVYDWSFYRGGLERKTEHEPASSVQAFFEQSLAWFTGSTTVTHFTDEWKPGEELAALVRERRTLLILDGLEPLLHPPGPHRGQLTSGSLRAFIKGVAENNPRGLCVITTREQISELRHLNPPTVVTIDLNALDPQTGSRLLQRHGVEGTAAQRRDLTVRFGGHALALVLLASLLRDRFGGKIPRKHVLFPPGPPSGQGLRLLIDGAPDVARHARWVMASYEHWFLNEGDLATLALFRLTGLFDRPARWDEVQILLEPPAIPGLTEPLVGSSPEQLRDSLTRLQNAKLITVTQPDLGAFDPKAHQISAYHPLIQEYCAEWLRLNAESAWREAHRRIYEHLKCSTIEMPDTVRGLQPLYRAVRHGCYAGHHEEVFRDVYRRRIQRSGRGFAHRDSSTFADDIAALACFFATQWDPQTAFVKDAELKAFLLEMASSRLRAAGRLADACQLEFGSYLENNLMQKWVSAKVNLRHLAEMNAQLGRLRRALHFSHIGSSIARGTEEVPRDSEEEIIGLTIRGYLQHQAGFFDEAEHLFGEAARLYHVWRDGRSACPCLHSVWGFRYCELLVDLGKLDQAEGLARQGLKPGRTPWDFGLGAEPARLVLGRILLARSKEDVESTQAQEAEIYLRSALMALRRTGKSEFIAMALIGLAQCLLGKREWAEAAECLKEAEAIASFGGMLLLWTDVALLQGQSALRRRRALEVRAALERVQCLIEQTESVDDGPLPFSAGMPCLEAAPQAASPGMGYHRRDREIELLKEFLGQGRGASSKALSKTPA